MALDQSDVYVIVALHHKRLWLKFGAFNASPIQKLGKKVDADWPGKW
jgi:hypothetical protein